jgi:Xaa-Pro aminopeptidase
MTLPISSQLLSRQTRVRQRLDALGLEAFVVTSATNIRYLTNHVGSSGVLVVTRDDAHLLVDSRYREAVNMLQRTDSACPDLLIRDVPESFDDALLRCLAEIDASAVGFEAAHVSVARHGSWQTMAERTGLSLAFQATDRIVEEARLVKDQAEVATLRDAAARSVLKERGFGGAFGHGTGHGLGLDVHEEPRITWPRSDVPSVRLESGMVFTIEPGAYLPGFGGVRIEDDVLVTETGCEVLTRVSRELRSV